MRVDNVKEIVQARDLSDICPKIREDGVPRARTETGAGRSASRLWGARAPGIRRRRSGRRRAHETEEIRAPRDARRSRQRIEEFSAGSAQNTDSRRPAI